MPPRPGPRPRPRPRPLPLDPHVYAYYCARAVEIVRHLEATETETEVKAVSPIRPSSADPVPTPLSNPGPDLPTPTAVCAWCHRVKFPEADSWVKMPDDFTIPPSTAAHAVTHGICGECYQEVRREHREREEKAEREMRAGERGR